jgi:FAD/FMN-containing dehydrogenase
MRFYFPLDGGCRPAGALAAEERFKSLVFTPRGGGTGTNGQALNAGIIVDMSRHMNRILEINPKRDGFVSKPASLKIS